MSKTSKRGTLPKNIDEIRTKEFIGSKAPSQTYRIDDAHAFAAHKYDNSLTVQSFQEEFSIKIISLTKESIVFDMIGIGTPLANALRRILIAEVPTMAIEKVNLYQNTSIIQDEVLSHRLGLIPIQVDPRKFKYLHESGNDNNEENTVVFVLQVECKPDGKEDTKTMKVTTKDMEWIPQGNQEAEFMSAPIQPVHDDILIAKLRPGQIIEAELLCEKGIGQTHAKWSPVCTASYRLLPAISFKKPVEGADADALVSKCPANVFDIEELGKKRKAVVARPRDCTMCRECIRESEWDERVALRREKEHFIFSVESTGAYKPEELLHEALKVLTEKCRRVLDEIAPE